MNEAKPPQESLDGRRRELIKWLWRTPVILAAVGASWGLREAYHVLFGKQRPKSNPSFSTLPAQRIAALSELAEAWQHVNFVYAGSPSILINLPEAALSSQRLADKELIALSARCTHQGCPVQLNTNTEAIAVAYGYRTNSPSLVCPCHFSVFSPSKAGQAVSGPAVEPLPRIQLELRDDGIYAVGVEQL